MRSAWLVIGLAGCWTSSVAVVPPAVPIVPAKPQPPALFAALVKPDATWTLPAEIVTAVPGQTDREAGTVTCETSTTVEDARWKVDLHCEGMRFADLVNGVYVITPAGMWIESTDETAALDGTNILLAATPVAYERRQEHEEHGSSFGSAVKAEPRGEAWCISHDDWGGDEGGHALCIQAGKGIVGVSGYFAGGMTEDLYAGDVPHH